MSAAISEPNAGTAALPSLKQILAVYCLAELARRCNVPRAKVWRARWGSDVEDSFIESLAQAMYQDADFIRAVVENDRARRQGAAS
jgi:hypothetical protein